MTKWEYFRSKGFYTTNPLFDVNAEADEEFKSFVDEFKRGVEEANKEVECDCCRQKVSKFKTVNLSLPILVHDDAGGHLGAKPMNVCESCANVILQAYYEEARKHNSSGWIGVTE